MSRWAQGLWAQLRPMASAVLVALTVRWFAGELFQIPSGSMIPTLAVGDRVLVNKLAYGVRVPFTATRLWTFGRPERGEVAVFISPTPKHEDYIKRIVAVGGDEVEVVDGQVILNGRPLERARGGMRVYRDRTDQGVWRDQVSREDCERAEAATYQVLADPSMPPTRNDLPPVTVPGGHVFVMGDNRDHSADSRAWGFVAESALLGRATRFFFLWGERGLSWRRFGWRVHHDGEACEASAAPSADPQEPSDP